MLMFEGSEEVMRRSEKMRSVPSAGGSTYNRRELRTAKPSPLSRRSPNSRPCQRNLFSLSLRLPLEARRVSDVDVPLGNVSVDDGGFPGVSYILEVVREGHIFLTFHVATRRTGGFCFWCLPGAQWYNKLVDFISSVYYLRFTHPMKQASCGEVVLYCPGAARIEAGGYFPMESEDSSHRR